MKVHPAPKKRNITIQYDVVPSLSSTTPLSCRQKKLRRLPHIFAKVLELPFSSDADVIINETPEFLRFIVPTDDIDNDVRASTIEIYPGVTKIVIIGNGGGGGLGEEGEGEFELDVWRFRLPGSTVPEMARAEYRDGDLIVTVPKGGVDDEVEDDEDVVGAGQLLLVH